MLFVMLVAILKDYLCYSSIYLFVVLGLELRAYTSLFLCVLGIFKIGSRELFARAGFKPQSSCSLPPEQLGLQV
jgi:hypothetical protein